MWTIMQGVSESFPGTNKINLMGLSFHLMLCKTFSYIVFVQKAVDSSCRLIKLKSSSSIDSDDNSSICWKASNKCHNSVAFPLSIPVLLSYT